MIWPAFPLAVLLALATGCSATPSDRASNPRVDSIFSTRIAADQPGCAVGVYRDGASLSTTSYGVADLESRRPLTVHSLFNLGSAAKQFTALATLTLIDQGRMALDDDVRRYVPTLPEYGTPIRVRDLLQHTSGIRDYGVLGKLAGRDVATLPEFVSLIAGQRSLNFTPGTQHEYSHSDFLLLAAIIEQVTGEPFGDYLERDILTPLGMTESRVHDTRNSRMQERAFGHISTRDTLRMTFPHDRIPGGQNLFTSVTDLARWDHALDEAAAGRLPLVAKLLERPTLANGDTIPYAFGIRKDQYRGLPIFIRGSNDNGTRTEIIRFPTQRFGIAVLCNRDDLPPGDLGMRLADAYIRETMEPRQAVFKAPPEVPLPEDQLAHYLGHFRSRGPSVDIELFYALNGKLAERLGDTVQTFTYRGNGKFTGDGSPDAFMLVFTDADTSGSQRVQFTFNDEPLEAPMFRLRESEIWAPTPDMLREYAGTWYSADIESSWNIRFVGGALRLTRRGTPDITLIPIQRDAFSILIGGWDGMNARMQFERNRLGMITRLVVSAGSRNEDVVRFLEFVRQP